MTATSTRSTPSPGPMPAAGPTRPPRFAAVGDLHCTVDAQGRFRALFERASAEADGLLLCGDLTDYGLAEEAQVLAEELKGASVPVVAVLGNHDFESGTPEVVRQILVDAGVRVLDGEACEIAGVGIAGIKGFAGGYGRGALGPWGEAVIKQFVQEALQEALKLETALAKLRTPHRIAVMHYSPVVDTVQGEPPEIFAFLGSSRLEEPLIRYPVHLAVHGHAHRGSPEGRTVNGTPVYNVAMPLLKRLWPDGPAYRLLALPDLDGPAMGAMGAQGSSDPEAAVQTVMAPAPAPAPEPAAAPAQPQAEGAATGGPAAVKNPLPALTH